MNKQKIEDPQNFQFASIVIKDSKTGITSNRRLLVVKGGHLFYYSNVPKFFNGNPKCLQYLHELPKSSIDIVNIKKLKPFEPHVTFFEIVFDQMFMMEREDIRKTLIQNLSFTPKKKKEEVVWRFTCESYTIKQKWIACLCELREYFLREKDEIQKYFWNMNDKDEMTSSVSTSKTAKTPWRESTVLRKQYSGLQVKSVGELAFPELQFLNEDKTKKDKKEQRLSNSYIIQPNLLKCDSEYASLNKTEGMKHLNMKKMKTMHVQSAKDM